MARPRKDQAGVPAAKPVSPKPEGQSEKPAPPVKKDSQTGIENHKKFDKFK